MSIATTWQKATPTRTAYTGDESRIILSFANDDGGDVFIHWLRTELMKKLNYYSQNSIYLDNVASRYACGPGRKPEHHRGIFVKPFFDLMSGIAKGAGGAAAAPLIGPDVRAPGGGTRDMIRNKLGIAPNGKHFPVGAMHDNWEGMWASALQTSKVLIQIQTKEYSTSWACGQELGRINAELGRAGSQLQILAITLEDRLPAMPIALNSGPRVTPMKLGRTVPQTGMLSHLKESWKISSGDLDRVVQFLRRHGC